MKKIYFLALFIIAASVTKAQFGQQGQKIITGSIGFNSFNGNNTTPQTNSEQRRIFLTQLAVGKFLKPNVLTNFSAGFGTGRFNTPQTQTNSNYNLGFEKIYYKELVKKLYFGVGGRLGANYEKMRSDINLTFGTFENDSYGVGFSIFPTLSYQLTNRFVANLAPSGNFVSVNYSYQKSRSRDAMFNVTESNSNNLNIGASFFSSPLQNLTIGFSYLLKRK